MEQHTTQMIDEEVKNNLNAEKTALSSEKTTLSPGRIALLVLLILLGGALIAAQSLAGRYAAGSPWAGCIAQAQVLLGVVLVTGYHKLGLIVSISINALCAAGAGINCIMSKSLASLPGVLVMLLLIIITCVIYHIQKNLLKKNKEMFDLNVKMVELNEMKQLAYEALNDANTELVKKNEKIEKNKKLLEFNVYYDQLTSIPNRKKLVNIMNDNFITHEIDEFAFILFHIQSIQDINKAFGHKMGDRAIITLSERLKYACNPLDHLGRFTTNEFAIVVNRKLSDQELIDYINSIVTIVNAPIELCGGEYTADICTGAARFPDDAANVDELMTSADLAMQNARFSENTKVVLYNPEMKQETLEKLNYQIRLTNALKEKDEQFFLLFQPQYYAGEKKLRGFEALVRWREPKLGLVSPVQFISISEENGLINEIGHWILTTACKQYKKLSKLTDEKITMSINISAMQLMQLDFVKSVQEVLDSMGVPAEAIELEITETVFISSVGNVMEKLVSLHELGVKIALDDFGTGFSSLNYLCQLPIDTLKIDKSFVDDIFTGNNRAKDIIGSIIDMAHRMNMSVVVEGVEQETQLDFLRQHNADIIQGFLWGRPMSAEAAEELVAPAEQLQ